MTKLLLAAALALAPVAVSAQSQHWMYESGPGGTPPALYYGAGVPQYGYQPPMPPGGPVWQPAPVPPPMNFYYAPSHPPMFSRPPIEDSDD